MNPAFSVVFLTTLIGAGQGLFLALVAIDLGIIGNRAVAGSAFFVGGDAVALALLIAGLGASFFHLGHPERAWRAAAMWRTSWLSREVIALPALMVIVCLHGVGHYLGSSDTGSIAIVTIVAVVAVVGTVLCLALFYITAMIYVCIKFLQEWATPLTVVNFTLLGTASGFTLATALAAVVAPALAAPLALWALALTFIAGAARVAALVRNARLRPTSTVQSAIGIRNPRIVQKSQGFMGTSFNTREFFHHKTPQAMRAVKWSFLLLAFVLPMVLLHYGKPAQIATVAVMTFLVQFLGLLAERWFFFAQANHPQNIYYQAIS